MLYAVGSLNDMPAWVQAIGSIAAILAAVAIAQRDIWHQRQLKLRESYDYMERAQGVASYASSVIVSTGEYILNGAPTKAMLRFHIDLLEVALEDLRVIDFSLLDDHYVAAAFVVLRRSVSLTRVTVAARLEDGRDFDRVGVAGWGPNAEKELANLVTAMEVHLSRNPSLYKVLDDRFPKG